MHTHGSIYSEGFAGAGRDAPSGGGDGYKANYYTPGLIINNSIATNQAVAASNASSAHNTIQPSIVKLFAIKYTPATGSMDSLTKGTTIAGYWATAPTGYLMEDGSAVSRATYSDLFAAIGTTYGAGDGSTTFNLPDSRGRVTVNKNPSDTEFDAFGEKTHLLTGVESGIKGHNHLQNPHTHSSNATEGSGGGAGRDAPNYVGGDGYKANYYTPGFSINNTTATNIAVASSNAASAHNNIQPSIVQNFAIRY